MKTTALFSLLMFAVLLGRSQTVPPGQLLSAQVAKRMKDSLNLSLEQYKSIYQVNMSLFGQQKEVFQQHTSRDSLRLYIQRIENKRDTLYAAVLLPDQYQRYRQKKVYLLSPQ